MKNTDFRDVKSYSLVDIPRRFYQTKGTTLQKAVVLSQLQEWALQIPLQPHVVILSSRLYVQYVIFLFRYDSCFGGWSEVFKFLYKCRQHHDRFPNFPILRTLIIAWLSYHDSKQNQFLTSDKVHGVQKSFQFQPLSHNCKSCLPFNRYCTYCLLATFNRNLWQWKQSV
jgi:hypothetical protein